MSNPAHPSVPSVIRAFPSGVYALCDDTVRPGLSMEKKAAAILHGGARVLQVRFKRTRTAEALDCLHQIVRACQTAAAICIVNDRVDWVLLTGADGVHLGAEDLPVREARALLGKDKWIGRTVRNLGQACAAKDALADYVGLGPIFETQTKQVEGLPLGLSTLHQVASGCPLPVVAISGINRSNIGEVAAAGAHAAAVVSAVLCAEDISNQVRLLQSAFDEGRALQPTRKSRVAWVP